MILNKKMPNKNLLVEVVCAFEFCSLSGSKNRRFATPQIVLPFEIVGRFCERFCDCRYKHVYWLFECDFTSILQLV